MSLYITDECIACDACREECPSDAINENDPVYFIDPDLCTECFGSYDEPSCVASCPVNAIEIDPDNIESTEELKFKFNQASKE